MAAWRAPGAPVVLSLVDDLALLPVSMPGAVAEQSAVRRWRWLPGSGVAGGLAVTLRL
jgi:hypothetical protein